MGRLIFAGPLNILSPLLKESALPQQASVPSLQRRLQGLTPLPTKVALVTAGARGSRSSEEQDQQKTALFRWKLGYASHNTQ